MAEVNYKPINSDITVKLKKVEKKTASGIIKSEEMIKEEQKKITGALPVVHCGPNVPKYPDGTPQISPGDKVLLRDGARLAEIRIGGVELQQVDSYQVLGVIGG